MVKILKDAFQSKKEKQLFSLYYTPNNPASFSGEKLIYDVLRKNKQNISIGDVKKWLKKQEVYNSHRKSFGEINLLAIK